MSNMILEVVLKVLPVILILLVILIILASGYVKASPDTAYIISGLRKQPKVLIGKAGIKIPFLEKKDELNLQLIPIQRGAHGGLYQHPGGRGGKREDQRPA